MNFGEFTKWLALANVAPGGGTAGGTPPAQYPTISDENATLIDEGDSTTNWSLVGGGPLSASNGAITVGPGANTYAQRSCSVPPTGDFILYAKLKCANASGAYSYIEFMNGGTIVLNWIFGYDWVGGAATQGAMSYYVNAGAAKGTIATGFDYTQYTTIAMHVDGDRGYINFWLQGLDGKWVWKAATPYFAGVRNINAVQLAAAGNASSSIAADWLVIAKPNIVAIGDSVTAGATLFDPNPAVYGASQNNDSTIWKHVHLYPNLRNNLVVNKGIGGQSSTDIRNRIAEATAHGARLVLLEASCNDYAKGVSASTRTGNIQASIDAIKGAGTACVLFNGIYTNSNYGANQANYNAFMQGWWNGSGRAGLTGLQSAIDTNVPVVDGTGTIAPANAQSDGIHPNPAGYQLIGNYLSGLAPRSGLFAINTSVADPIASDIPAGQAAVFKNTSSGALKLWVNDGGTLKSVALS